MKKLVAYYRVSTRKQEQSGLGLEGQQSAVAAYAAQHGATILSEHIEVETGKKGDRPELAHALARARRSKATLVVAKLDRLARNVAFTSALMESRVDFVCCDNPYATKLTIHILAAVAEHEAEQISQRTKTALAAAKRRGVKLGSARPGHWKGRERRRLAGARKGGKAAASVHQKAADEAYTDIYPMLAELDAEGLSLRAIAKRLNDEGYRTRRDREWNPMQVRAVLKRMAAAAA